MSVEARDNKKARWWARKAATDTHHECVVVPQQGVVAFLLASPKYLIARIQQAATTRTHEAQACLKHNVGPAFQLLLVFGVLLSRSNRSPLASSGSDGNLRDDRGE